MSEQPNQSQSQPSTTSMVGIKSMQIEAVIIRADGTKENLGVISRWDSNWFKRLQYKIGQWYKTGLEKFKNLRRL